MKSKALADLEYTSEDNARLSRLLETQRLQIEKLLMDLYRAEENERRRLAAELHDGVTQWLVGAAYDIKTCRVLVAAAKLDESAASLAGIGETIQNSIRELRRSIANLRPPTLTKLGLVGALRKSIEVFEGNGTTCRLTVQGKPRQLSMVEESTVYWAAQEMISNVRKHAKASEASLQVQYRNGTVSIKLTDNGVGFDPDEVMNGPAPLGHVGLAGMKERAELLGGSVEVLSSPGQGTSVCVALPVSARTASVARSES